MFRGVVWYVTQDNGDGSASTLFFADEETAQLACDKMEKGGDAFSDNEPNKQTLAFNEKGKLLNTDAVPDYYDEEDEEE